MSSITVDIINSLYDNDEFKPIIITGGHGYGKSVYAMKVAAQVLSANGNPNWSAVKDNIVFHPKEFLKLATSQRKRRPLLIWDDAGYWLNALDFNNPFVKSVGKYLQVVRSDYGCIIFTCIDVDDVLKKVRGISNSVMIKIIKDSDATKPHRRIARGYRYWKSPDGSRFGRRTIFEEHFNKRMPDDVYNEWYRPLRNSYAKQAKSLMVKHLDKLDK